MAPELEEVVLEHSLPVIPTLPPLVMPESHQPRRPTPRRNQSSLTASSTSLVSRDSFTTAYTSSPIGTPTTNNADPSNHPSSPSNTTPSSVSLRKSFSVDSLTNHLKESPTASIKRTKMLRPSTSSTTDSRRGLPFEASEGYRRETERRVLESRNRAESVSTMGDGYDSSNAGESDHEHSEYHRRTDWLTKRASRGQSPCCRLQLRGGENSLPLRKNALSATSSLGSITSSQNDAHRNHAAASIHSISKNVSSGRPRSDSLGTHAVAQPMVINTSISTNTEISLLVIGSSGCGKTTVIHKGLKIYKLSDPTTLYVNRNLSGSARYTHRIGKVTHGQQGPDVPLHVYEADVSLCNLDNDPACFTFLWPESAPRIDGVFVCYDASDRESFLPVLNMIAGFRSLKLPTMVLACKTDLPRQVEPRDFIAFFLQSDVGLVEVNNEEDLGKARMRRSFDWVLKAILKQLMNGRRDDRNIASPGIIEEAPPPWHSRTPTPLVMPQNQSRPPPVTSPSPSSPSSQPNSPRHSRSEGNLVGRAELQVTIPKGETGSFGNVNQHKEAVPHLNGQTSAKSADKLDDSREDPKDSKDKESRSAQWATLEELLDKLLFLAVSGDDPSYITHFLLTYRRFATPRTVLLAMQKRMRQLDNPSSDPMFACFAQMRICHLLELWIRDYPYDFAVRGTQGALSALVKSIISKTHLLHYGSDFLPFLELIPNLEDKDDSWALRVEDSGEDDSYSPFDDDSIASESESLPANRPSEPSERPPILAPMIPRGRTLSRPPTAKTLVMPKLAPGFGFAHIEVQDIPQRQIIKELQRVAHDINVMDSQEIAQEITRIEAKLFLDIEPRHWLHYTLVSGKKDPLTDTIARFNEISNHLAHWVVSLILCHDKPKIRAKQIEKFVDVAYKLRLLNNYSALRAFVAGINNSAFNGDPTLEYFKQKSPEPAKLLRSWDILLQHVRSHRAYRMALKVTKGACIPALEVHMSDLIRAHEGNPDENVDQPGKIHWGKFNLIGKFISSTTQCQAQCRNSTDYVFQDNPVITELVLCEHLMSEEMQKARIDMVYDEQNRDNMQPPRSRFFPWG